MSAAIVKTNSAEIRASRINREDIEALIEMREQFAKSGAAEIAEHRGAINVHESAIIEIEANLRRLGIDVADASIVAIKAAPVAPSARASRGHRHQLDGDTLIARARGVVIERDKPMTATDVANVLGMPENVRSVEQSLYVLASRQEIDKVGPRTFAPNPKASATQTAVKRILGAFERMPALFELRAAEVQKLCGSPKISTHRIHREMSVMAKSNGRLERVGKGLYRLIKKDA